MAYKPHEQLPLLLFGIFVAPLSVISLTQINSVFAFELAALITMLLGVLLVVAFTQHWRFA